MKMTLLLSLAGLLQLTFIQNMKEVLGGRWGLGVLAGGRQAREQSDKDDAVREEHTIP